MLLCVRVRQSQCCDFLVMQKAIKAIKWVIKAAQSEVLTDAITKQQHWCIVTVMESTSSSRDLLVGGLGDLQ